MERWLIKERESEFERAARGGNIVAALLGTISTITRDKSARTKASGSTTISVVALSENNILQQQQQQQRGARGIVHTRSWRSSRSMGLIAACVGALI
jgi:hypothetical protein